ncbi:hypothetical protein P9112_009411 [Eukaryota sp. TZLM1-RC]
MRMRCYLWPCNLPNDLFCKCGAGLTLSHLFNCNRYISYRSTLHDAVRDQIHAMCNSYHIESFVEPLLRSLDINESVRDSEYGKRRADVVVPSFDDVMNVVDVVTVDVCKKNALKNAHSEVSPLDDSELYKRKKYANPLKELKHVRHVDYQICPFAISLYGRLGKTALNFIDDFENLVKKRMNKRFDRRLWLNRIVFTIFKSIPKMISKALMSVSAHYENIVAVRFDASIVFDRVKDKASTFLHPHQFGIKTIDGASVAAIASDTFFNAEENNFIFNLDFKNAFNSVKREVIFEVIKSDFPELSSFFYHCYGKESDLIFNSFGLKSSSGVKQGDPLGPLLFCLAIHKTLNIIKQKYPSIKIVAYMDDISLIGSFDLLELVAQEIADSYENIGLHLNASKCLLIGSSAQDLVINDSIVPFTNYSSDAFKFLGCWLGNVPQIQNELQVIFF